MSKILIEAFPKERRRVVGLEEEILDIAEMFSDTLQGENFVGYPATFVRLQHCTLSCIWCFGIKSGRRIPRIIGVRDNKKINEVKIGDKLLTFDENKRLVETIVYNTTSREVTKWREIKIDSKIYFVTEEHPFFITNGLKRADELKEGDMIYHLDSRRKVSYLMKKQNPMFDSKVVEKAKSKIDWKELGRKISQTIKKKQINGTYQPTFIVWRKNDPKLYRCYRKRSSERMKGENNPNWQGGKNLNFHRLKSRKDRIGYCQECKEYKKLEVHHIDLNPDNDSLDNLSLICHKCHSIIHQRGYNFWNSERKDRKLLQTNAEQAQNGLKVIYNKEVDITKNPWYGRSYGPKPLRVYNISCEPYNTYLVDWMWVHNCDTREVWRKGNPYTIDEILNLWKERGLIEKFSLGQKLVFTGGSPLLQQVQITNLINKFSNEFNFIPDIEIENECTLYPDQELVNLVFCWNNSPKLSNSAQSKKARYFPDIIREMSGLDNSWFKFVISKEEDWKEIEEDFLKPKLIDKKQIVLMPEGQTQKELQVTRGFVAEIAIRENIRFTDRLHITIWNKTVGV